MSPPPPPSTEGETLPMAVREQRVSGANASVSAMWTAARHASACEDWVRAAELWNELIYLEGEGNSEPFLETGRALLAQGQREEAISLLRLGLNYHEGCPDLLEARGILLVRAGYLRAAEQHFERATRSDAERPSSWFWLGRTRLALDLPRRALQPLRSALALDSSDCETHYLLARALRATGVHAEAARHYQHALPEDAECAVERLVEAASLYAQHPELFESDPGALTRSWSWLDECVERSPQHAMGHFVRGLLHERAGQPDQALEAYRRAVEVDNFHLEATTNLALLHHARGEVDRAAELAQRALALESDPTRQAALRAHFLEGTGEPIQRSDGGGVASLR